MTRRHLCALALAAAFLAPACKSKRSSGVVKKAKQECVVILSWNDLHGQLEPDLPFLDSGRVPAGGVVSLAEHVELWRRNGDPVVVLDAGDLFTGPMESTLAEGAPVIAAYAAIGVDAAALGNHEFDFGPVGYDRVVAAPGLGDAAGADGPRGALFARMREAPFPFLSANLRSVGGAKVAWPNHAAHTIVKKGSFSVGVVGYTTEETPRTTLRPNVEGLDFSTDAAAHVAESIRALRAAGAAPVVLLAHSSLEGDLPQVLDDPKDPKGERHHGEIANLVRKLGPDVPDLIVAGHRHAWMLGRVQGIPIVSSDQHGVGYAHARFCVEAPGHKPVLQSIEREVAFAGSSPTTALGKRVAAIVKPFVEATRARADEVITHVPRICLPHGPAGTGFVEQIARAMLDRAIADGMIEKDAAAVAVINSGGVRAPLFAGPLRYRDLFTALPFENALSTCTTTRAGLFRALSNLAKRNTTKDRFAFGIAGAKVRARRTPTGNLEILSLELEGDAKANDDRLVTVVIPDFLLYGGDGFPEGVTCSSSTTAATRIRDAYRTVIAAANGGCDGPPQNVKLEVP